MTVDPCAETPAPTERSISAVMSTSPIRGALSTVLGPSASSEATISLVTAFLDPLISTSPTRGPLGSIRHIVAELMAVASHLVGGPASAAGEPARRGALHELRGSSSGRVALGRRRLGLGRA